jgi:hypothetical protein
MGRDISLMKHDLVELETKALDLRNAGKFAEAAEIFSAIVRERPDWEHGLAFYDLANCYEDMGHFDKALRMLTSRPCDINRRTGISWVAMPRSFICMGTLKGHSRRTWTYWKSRESTRTTRR